MQKKSSIKARILQYLEFKGISKYEFYKKSGITRGVLDQNTGLSEDSIYKIIAYAQDVSLNWLMFGDGDMLISDTDIKLLDNYSLRTDSIINTQQVPLYNLSATAGLCALFVNASNQIPIDYISIPNLPKCDGAVYVTGDSMYPLLKAGDIVLYKQIHDIQSHIIYGEMYLVSYDIEGDEYIVVKYIQKSDKAGYVKLVSSNQYHEPYDIPYTAIRAVAHIKASVRLNCIR